MCPIQGSSFPRIKAVVAWLGPFTPVSRYGVTPGDARPTRQLCTLKVTQGLCD